MLVELALLRTHVGESELGEKSPLAKLTLVHLRSRGTNAALESPVAELEQERSIAQLILVPRLG